MKSDAARQTAVRDFVIPHVDLKKARLLLEAEFGF